MNPRAELIALLRGSFATPVLAALGSSGAVKNMALGPFTLKQAFPAAAEPVALAVVDYLLRLGLIIEAATEAAEDKHWELTSLGGKVLARWGSAAMLHSYRDLAAQLPALLTGEAHRSATVDRQLNVLGSGSLHTRKFFPPALRSLEALQPRVLVDLGCGDGTFLVEALHATSPQALLGLDLSPVAVKAADQTVQRARTNTGWTGIWKQVVASAEDVSSWASLVPSDQAPVTIAMWFILHEFCAGETTRALRFFETLHHYLPQAHFLLGEIVAAPHAALAEHRHTSVMPEYLFFHSLSGQGVLSWAQFEQLRECIPYRVVSEQRFDVLGDTGIPSSLFWHLQPK